MPNPQVLTKLSHSLLVYLISVKGANPADRHTLIRGQAETDRRSANFSKGPPAYRFSREKSPRKIEVVTPTVVKA
jgi:hypothetical protein